MTISRRAVLSGLVAGIFFAPNGVRASPSKTEIGPRDIATTNRQGYLDQLLTDHKELFPNIERIKYVGNAVDHALGISQSSKDITTIVLGQNNGTSNFLDLLHDSSNSYASVDVSGNEELGKGKNSIVNVYDRAFDDLSRTELIITLVHEQVHCRDIYEGIKLGNKEQRHGTQDDREDVDFTKLSSEVTKVILEARATYLTLIYMEGMLIDNGEEMFKKYVSERFIEGEENKYIFACTQLTLPIQEKLSSLNQTKDNKGTTLTDYEFRVITDQTIKVRSKYSELFLKYHGDQIPEQLK